MFLFRRCKLPSAKLAIGVLLLWSLAAGMAWIGLAADFDPDQIIKHAGILAYFSFFSAPIPAIIHYAILRRGSTLRMEWATLIIIGAISITALTGQIIQLQREGDAIWTLYYRIDQAFISRCESMHDQGQYPELLSLLEQEFVRYEELAASMGGTQEIAGKTGRQKFALADGTSDLFCNMQLCIDYNAQFTPRNVEFFLMSAMHYGAGKTPKLQALAGHLSQSKQAVLKAYGLWMLNEHHAYRDFAYQHAGQGEAWAYGFAADATQHDFDPQHALDVLDRYEKTVIAQSIDPSYLWDLDSRIAKKASLLNGNAQSLSPSQNSLLNRVLNRSLENSSIREDPNITSLFHLMGRPEDTARYLARIQHNYDKHFRAYMIEMLLEKNLLGHLNPDTIREMHQVLDKHLITGETPGITTEQMHRIFNILGRGSEIETKNR